jgi:hypothetical protein
VQAEILHLPPSENDLALNDQDRAWIHQEINAALQRRTPWWQKLIDLVPITAVIAIALFVITQWTTYVEFRTRTGDRLDNIEKLLTKQTLASHAELPLADFKLTLPALTSTMARAKQEHINVSPEVITGIQKKLLATDTQAPGFWPAASEFISYRSQVTVGWNNVNLPLCGTTPAAAEINSITPKGREGNNAKLEMSHGPFVYRDCKIILDSPEATASISPVLGFGDLIFDHCVVFYNGGPIVLVALKVAAEPPPHLVGDLNFTNCLFVFSFPVAPPPVGQRLATTLLAAETETSVNFNPNPT